MIASAAIGVSWPQGNSQIVPLQCSVALPADQHFPRRFAINVDMWTSLSEGAEHPSPESQPA